MSTLQISRQEHSSWPTPSCCSGETTDRSIGQAVIECDNNFQERILFRLASLGDGADDTQDSELAVAAAQLHLADRLIFDLHGKRSRLLQWLRQF